MARAADEGLSRAVRLYSFERYEEALALVDTAVESGGLGGSDLRDA